MSSKTILGLDLGTTSIGWALVREDQNNRKKSEIIKLGVRVNPLTTDEKSDFEKGKALSSNTDRTLKRGARRNLQRYKQRRSNLVKILVNNGLINSETILAETVKNSTFETLRLRAKAAKSKIENDEFARVLLNINKKRGYKSSRKAKNEEEDTLIDGMEVAKKLYDDNLTPGQFVFSLLNDGKNYIPDFYRSDLQNEFDSIWNFQRHYYPEVLTDKMYLKLQGQGKLNSIKLFLANHQINTAENKGKEARLRHYKWRSEALSSQLTIEEVAYVLVEINNNLNKSSGYLGAIGDRSKALYFNKETVGEYLCKKVNENQHSKLRNQVFYRQDYLDEFEKIWETQARFNPILTPKLKAEVRDITIFYQRKLKSQKHLIAECEFEKQHKAIPRSSPLFQEFRVWQMINNLEFSNGDNKEMPSLNVKKALFEDLSLRDGLSANGILKFCGYNKKEWKTNFKEGIEGNRTNEALFNVYQKIAEAEGYGHDWSKKTAKEILEELRAVFTEIGIDSSILEFDSTLGGDRFDKQLSYQLWHLLYSVEDDQKINPLDAIIYGNSNVALKKKLHLKYGFKPVYSNWLANISLNQDYGSLSAKAIKKILPFLKDGHTYSDAAELAGYNHSSSISKEEQEKRILKDHLDLLKKNSLRNPVVEKILNQMVNLVNQLIRDYGKPDEIRIELARELKKSAKEREDATKGINQAKKRHEAYRKILQNDFQIKNPTRNDIIKYKLYLELKDNGFKTIYTNRYIPKDKLFSKEIDIEHIVPKSKLFDDSFSNKTLSFREFNQEKSNSTAIDFIEVKYPEDVVDYTKRVNDLFKNKSIGKAKATKLLMTESDIPAGFIDRDLRDSQYIAKKAKEMLCEVIRSVNTTTGVITNRLREDWDLMNILQELTLSKFKAIDPNLIEQIEKKDGTFKTRIKGWSKRNDHRHHAMDALTVAFTKHSHVQYLNNLNAKSDKKGAIFGILEKETTLDKRGRRKFIAPMPNFREEAKKHLENVLVSFKNKNKVITKNKNRIKINGKDSFKTVTQLTPRGQLHKETVYGKMKTGVVKLEKISGKFDKTKILQVTKTNYREALLKRLEENNNDPKKAFTGKNGLSKNPIFLNVQNTKLVPGIVKTQFYEEIYTIRKDVDADLKIEKVVDQGIRVILKKRLEKYNNDPKLAFTNLTKNPIWLNKEKGIAIKSVKITGVKNAEALHDKKDILGKLILNEKGNTQPTDFVSLGNNHHIAIYRDEKGRLQEDVVSFYKAVARATAGDSIVNKGYNIEKGWQFLFTLKQNEMFVFPKGDFDPNKIDLMDENNYALISSNLYRVQKIASKDYYFRHHLETKVDEIKALRDVTFIRKQSLAGMDSIIKVRINHLGQIVQVGEY
mgnify:CR=1 FL=1